MVLGFSGYWFSSFDETFARLVMGERVMLTLALGGVAFLYAAFRAGRRLWELRTAEALKRNGVTEVVKPESLPAGAAGWLEYFGPAGRRRCEARMVAHRRGVMVVEIEAPGMDCAPTAGTPLRVTLTYGGALLECDTVVRDRDDSNGNLLLYVQRPSWLARVQRRRNFRVPVLLPAMLTIKAAESREDTTLRGLVNNLSGGGFRAAVPQPVTPGAYIRARFRVEGAPATSFDARVVECARECTQAGFDHMLQCEFIQADEQTRNQIINYCFDVDRENLRKRKGYSAALS